MKQVAPSVRSLGVSIEWLAGAYIMLDKAGIRNEEAGTAIKSMFKSIVQPTASARGMMAQLGIDPSEFTKRAAGVKSEQLIKRLAAEYGKDFSKLGPELQRILESGGTTVAMQKALVGAIESQWGKMKPQDARKLAKTVGNFLASGVSAIDPQAWLDALAKRGVTFGQFLQMVEPRQAQRLSNLAQQAGEAGDAARKALETPLTQMLDFKRGLADAAAAKMMQGYPAAIAKLAAAWTSFIETLDTSGVIDKVASALTSLGTALAKVFKGDASLKDWGIALAAALPLIAPLATAITGLAFAFKGLAAALSLAAAAFIKLPLAGIAGLLGAGTGTGAGVGTAAAGLGVAATLRKGALPGAALAGLTAIKRDAEKEGQPLRTWLRSVFGIGDEHEPAPWQKGGAWHPLTAAEAVRSRFPEQSAADVIRDRFPGPAISARDPAWKKSAEIKPWPDQSEEAAAAAKQSTQAFVANLEAGLRQAEAAVQSSVQRMMQMLSFSASPSITPKIAPAPGSGATPMRGTAPAATPSPTRTAARGLYADYDNGGDLDWV